MPNVHICFAPNTSLDVITCISKVTHHTVSITQKGSYATYRIHYSVESYSPYPSHYQLGIYPSYRIQYSAGSNPNGRSRNIAVAKPMFVGGIQKWLMYESIRNQPKACGYKMCSFSPPPPHPLRYMLRKNANRPF